MDDLKARLAQANRSITVSHGMDAEELRYWIGYKNGIKSCADVFDALANAQNHIKALQKILEDKHD